MNRIIKQLIENKIVAVVRGRDKVEALKISDACFAGGINAIEVTFTVPNAELVIKELSETRKEILVGAGTVLNVETCKLAIDNGAKYIVSPGFDLESALYCQKKDVPYIPGCMTITEIMNATKNGVELIKLFPGSAFGPTFVKSILGPLPNVKLMPTGGVDLNNIEEWFENGVVAVGIGSALTKYAKTNDFDKIVETAKAYVNKVGVING